LPTPMMPTRTSSSFGAVNPITDSPVRGARPKVRHPAACIEAARPAAAEATFKNSRRFVMTAAPPSISLIHVNTIQTMFKVSHNPINPASAISGVLDP